MRARFALQAFAAWSAILLLSPAAVAEDGYELWLRYRSVEAPQLESYRLAATQLVGDTASPVLKAAADELRRGLSGLLAATTPSADHPSRDGAIIFGTAKSSPTIASLHLDLGPVGPEGFLIRSITVDGRRATVIAANEEIGVLYGVFNFLRLIQTRRPIDGLSLVSAPRLTRRLPQSLGQSRRFSRARLRGRLPVAVAHAARLSGAPLLRLRTRLRVTGHQRHRTQQRQCQRLEPHAAILEEDCRPRRRVQAVWCAGLSERAVQRTDRNRRPCYRRPAGSGSARLVARQS